MRKRTITGIIMAAVSLPCLIFSDTWIFPIAIAFLSVIGVHEMLRCLGLDKYYIIKIPLCIAALGFPLAARFADSFTYFIIAYISLMFAMLIYLLSIPVFRSDDFDSATASYAFVTAMYIITGFSCEVLLRDMKGGIYYFLVPILAPFTCDIFAYFTGRLFGKHKLIPKISPNKTVEGSIGGTVFCIAICTGYGAILRNVFSVTAVFPVWTFAVGGLLIALVSQLGDLVASAIKRQHGIKDYGRIFPGHGGVMDRFDSVIPTVPLFLVLMLMFEKAML